MHSFAIVAIFLGFALLTDSAYGQSEHRCTKDALVQAQKLLEFHFGPDNRIAVDKSVKVLVPIRNPAETKQQFDVLEVWGSIYKGRYRMRLIYAQIPKECLLMGQEILEYAHL